MPATGPRRSLGHRFLIECRNTLIGVVLGAAVIAAAIGVVIGVTAVIAR
jgi:hypothetical protein